MSLLQDIVVAIGKRTEDLRKKILATEKSVKKIKGMAGTDWRHSKYLNLISTLQTMKCDMKSSVKDAMDIVNEAAYYGAILNGKGQHYSTGGIVNLKKNRKTTSN